MVLASTEPVEALDARAARRAARHGVEALCDELARSTRRPKRGFVLAQVAGGYRFQTHPDLAPGTWSATCSTASTAAAVGTRGLETLAIVAYKQPISRGQMSAIRGVNVEATLTTLLQRGYVQEVGPRPGSGCGGPLRHHP